MSIPLTILAAYVLQFIIRMIYFEIKQCKAAKIYLQLDDRKDTNIKPFFGWWKGFTNKSRFTEDSTYSNTTINYKGLKRIGINALAALTFAKYNWKGV